MYANENQVSPTVQFPANGQTQLNVGVTSGTPLLPIPTLDCFVQVVGANARCDVSVGAVQPGASSYINTYRGFQLMGSASADMTATGFSIAGDDYLTYIYFHQGNFTDPGTNAALMVTAAGGKVTGAEFLNVDTFGLPPSSLLAPAIGSSSAFGLSFPSIPYLGIDPNYQFSFFQLQQFLGGSVNVVAVPEPNSLWLALGVLAVLALRWALGVSGVYADDRRCLLDAYFEDGSSEAPPNCS